MVFVLLWFGSLWGATEALAGGLLHLVLPPTYAGRVMLLVAGSLCTLGVRATGRSWAPLVMALIAAPLKLLSAAIYGVPVAVPMVMTPFFAILSQGIAFAAMARWILTRPAMPRLGRYALYGALGGAAQGLLFVCFGSAASRWLYPPPEVIAGLGMVYPAWMLSPAGGLALLAGTLPWALLCGAAAAVLASRLSLVRLHGWSCLRWAAGAALWLVVFLLSTWLV